MNVLVFDTETAGPCTQSLLNVGYRIIDIDIQHSTFKTLVERDYLVREVYQSELFMLNDMFVGAEKYNKYKYLEETGKIILRTPKQIFMTMGNDIEKYKTIFGYAFNCDFDTDKFTKTAQKYSIDNPLEKIPIFDIWAYALNYICKTPEYIAWAKENEVFTKSGAYIQTSVEAIVKYLDNDLAFEEQHTALDDSKHETNILMECVRRGCDITRSMRLNGRFIPSEKVFTQTIEVNGEIKTFNYKKKVEKDGLIKFVL